MGLAIKKRCEGHRDALETRILNGKQSIDKNRRWGARDDNILHSRPLVDIISMARTVFPGLDGSESSVAVRAGTRRYEGMAYGLIVTWTYRRFMQMDALQTCF